MLMKKSLIAEITKCIAFVLVLCFIIKSASGLLIRKNEYLKYSEFYTEKDQFDVLFFGSSRVLDAIQPMELYKNYGIKSYNMAQHNETVGRSYWSIKNAIKYNKPKVAVVDVSLFAGEIGIDSDSYDTSKAYMHNTLDHMPFSLQKIEAVNALCSKDLRAEYLFPFLLYHSRWNELNSADFNPVTPPRKGAEIRNLIAKQVYEPWHEEDRSDVFFPDGINLDKIIELCKEEDVDLIFTCMPVPEGYFFGMINTMEDYFTQNGVQFVNFGRLPDLFDYEVNFADGGHLNQSGSKLATEEMGRYLTQNYSFSNENRKTDSEWDKVLDRYLKEKEDLILTSVDDPKYLLMNMIGDDDFSCEVGYTEEFIEKYDLRAILSQLNKSENNLILDQDYGATIKVFRESDKEVLIERAYE